jgi:1-acyl-sn-glycerol-3-phosphate acyltransferase
MRQSLKIFYKSVIVEGAEMLDPKKPLLIASTHPNSFLDAIIMGTVFDREMFFLARSDVFKQKWADYILRKMNLIPIYRLQEGHENLNKNDITFKSCYDILENNGAVLIFAEGLSLIDKKVRPPKKGLARIGFGAEEKNNFELGIEVNPIGINYESSAKCRNRILVKVESPILLSEYQTDFIANQNTAYQNLNKELFVRLKEATIEAENEELFDLIANQIKTSSYTFNKLKTLQKKIEKIKSGMPEFYLKLGQASKNILELEQKYEFKTSLISQKNNSILFQILLFIPALLGFLINFPPIIVASKFSDKKVKLIEFYASVRLVLSSILWLIWVLIILIIIGITNGIGILFFAIPIIMLFTGKAYIKFFEFNRISKSNRNFKKFKNNKDFELYKNSLAEINELIPNSI